MFLVELVMQGVRGVRELARLRFKSGFNIVVAGNESGKTTSVDSVLRLLFPDQDPGRMDPFISRYVPDASRAALVAFSDDGAYSRVIEDFSKRAVNLSLYNAATKEFVLKCKDWENTAQFMAGLTAGMSEADFARLFILRREQLAGLPDPAPASAPAQPRTAPAAPVVAGASPAREARLAELRETMRKAEEAADADYKVQAGKLRLEEIRKKMEAVTSIDQRIAEIEANLGELQGCAGLPENLEALLEEHERKQVQKTSQADDLRKELDALQLQLDTLPRSNIMKDPLLIAGVVIGAAAVLAGVLALIPTAYAHFFPLGVLLGLGLVAAAWYKGSRKTAERTAIEKEVGGVEADLAELEKSFEHGGGEIQACMTATGAATVAELKDKAENYRYFLAQSNEVMAERQRLQGDVSMADLQAEYDRQQEAVAELEQAARAVAHNAVDTYSIRQDIERLESELGGAAAADFGFAAPEHVEDFSASVQAPAAPVRGGFLAELALAGKVGGIELETLIPAVEAAAQRNLAAVSGGKYVRIEAGHEGLPVVHANDDSPLNYGELSSGTRDLVFFCLRTGLVEALAGKHRMPFLLDDPLAGFDPARQQAACQVLRSLGAKTQVILFTSNPALKAAGDAAAELK